MVSTKFDFLILETIRPEIHFNLQQHKSQVEIIQTYNTFTPIEEKLM